MSQQRIAHKFSAVEPVKRKTHQKMYSQAWNGPNAIPVAHGEGATVLFFYFLKTSNLSFLAAKKSKKSVLRIGRLEKIELETFSQDALFGLFGRQRAQIGRLEEKKPQARFPAGLHSVGLIETLYDSFHLSE